MIKLQYRTTDYGLPILNKKEIDILAEALVYDFSPECMQEPQPIDVDMFCESYLGLTQDFTYLSHCGIYLGMMVFHDTDKIAVYNPETNKAEYKSVKAGTVLIDNCLVDTSFDKRIEYIQGSNLLTNRDKQRNINKLEQRKKSINHRYRFTMGHEAAGHGVLHASYFDNKKNEMKSAIQCRVARKDMAKDYHAYTDHDWMEIQADYMAGSFLMPVSMVYETIRRMESEIASVWSSYKYYLMVMKVSEVFDVSIEAACIRLKQLGVIPKNHRQI